MKWKLICCAAAISALSSVGAGAQSGEVKSTTKTKVVDGQDITTTGCVDHVTGNRFVLNSPGGETQYVLVGKNDFAKHVGQRVEIKGKATDLGNAKVTRETTTKTEVEHGKDQESRVKSSEEGKISGFPMLGVQSVKVLSGSCP